MNRELYKERLNRTKKFIEIGAPEAIIGEDMLLVLRSIYGSEWGIIKHILKSKIYLQWHLMKYRLYGEQRMNQILQDD